MGPRKLKELRAYVIRSFDHLEPGDVYLADGHCFDAEVRHPDHGRPFRPEIVTVIDVATRKVVGFSMGLAESGHLVADALRAAVEKNGVPSIFYTDRGSGFINERLAGEAMGILARVGITHRVSLPYNSQARGVIERLHKSIWVRAAKELPSYMGAAMDPEVRQLVFKRGRNDIVTLGRSWLLPEWADFCGFARVQVTEYNARTHRSLGQYRDEAGTRVHRSPDEAWGNFAASGWSPVMLNPVELQDLFRPYEMRKVQRGTITFRTGIYFSRELEAQDLHGQDVQVGFDPTDPTYVWVRNLDGNLICSAEIDANKVPYFPKSEIQDARERRARGRLRRLETHAEEVRAELGTGELPAIQAEPFSDADRARLIAEMAAEPVRVETCEERLARAEDLEGRLAVGEILPSADEQWLEGFRNTSEYRAWKSLRDDPNVAWLDRKQA